MARIRAANVKEWLTPIGIIAVIAFLSWFIWDDLRNLRDDLGDLRDDVHSIEVRLAVVQTDLAHIKDDVAEIKDDLKEIKNDVKEIREILQSGQSTYAVPSKPSPASQAESGQ